MNELHSIKRMGSIEKRGQNLKIDKRTAVEISVKEAAEELRKLMDELH
ncbi:hypothetical protein ACSOV8_16445 [Bacillus halotolerans]